MSPAPASRAALRGRLLEQREQFMKTASSARAADDLARHLGAVLQELEPELLGLYWPHRSEFNAAAMVLANATLSKLAKCLPFSQRAPVTMHYRTWDGEPPTVVDECGIPASAGSAAQPDVVLVPCVGFSADGYRLGYGGGYFDRWLAQHPDATAIGVAWSGSEIDAAELGAQPHDLPLTLIVTERGVV